MLLKFGTIEQTVHFNASPQEVFEALLDAKKHSEFTRSPATTSRRTGARFTAWGGYISGKNIKLVKDRTIVQEWKTIEWPKGYPSSRLEFTLTAKKNGTNFKMTHSKVPVEQLEDYRNGWHTSYWTPLKEYFAKKKSIGGPTGISWGPTIGRKRSFSARYRPPRL